MMHSQTAHSQTARTRSLCFTLLMINCMHLPMVSAAVNADTGISPTSKFDFPQGLHSNNHMIISTYHKKHFSPSHPINISSTSIRVANAGQQSKDIKKPDTKILYTKKGRFMKPDAKQLKSSLSPIQYKVTQKNGTEPPFKNEYWDNKKEGIYVDIVSGEPLFSSTTKFKSGTGWPSFYEPLDKSSIVEKSDRKFFIKRTEVRSKDGDSHLGHVFDDGPNPTGLRYCINSASLRFIPVENLEKEGFGEYLDLFTKTKNQSQ